MHKYEQGSFITANRYHLRTTNKPAGKLLFSLKWSGAHGKTGTLILKSNHIVIVVLTFYKQTEGNF